MSGIYISGMEMPRENNERCFIFRFYPNGHICDEMGNVYKAIPVPDHGYWIRRDAYEYPSDLIDRDAYAYPADLMDEPVIFPKDEEDT